MNMTNVKARAVKLVIGALMVGGVANQAMADAEYYENARVISAVPQVERVNMPRQECRTEYVQGSYSNSDRSAAGAIIGGIAGGLLGGTVGRGSGRVASAAIGAGVGAVVGDRVDNSNNTSYGSTPVQRCVTVDNWQSVNRGFLVTYDYNGHQLTTVTDRDPGQFIQVRIGVSAGNGVTSSNYSNSTYSSTTYSPAPTVIYRETVPIAPPVVYYGGYPQYGGWGPRGGGWGGHDRHRDAW